MLLLSSILQRLLHSIIDIVCLLKRNNEEELTKDLKGDLETVFRYGLGAKSYDHTLNKYMTDHFIKTYLTELGYNSFDDVRESEKHYIYRNGEFPVWDSIEEDQLTE